MIPTTGPRAPHQGAQPYHPAPNAALLIDFDNVTMGIRSDLGKELKALLNSDVIRGKVAVQRAYADWRRYPQYIVPLAESSIDLIFAPAYGSSRKNATDLRMAIDAIELVFTRPEIGTFILMTGDSDFSSCVLKLKEYGKYVIGVGMRQSSSDLLIQNCDEYYSYHSLSGLTRTGETEESKEDPWTLVQRAADRMRDAGDVMRTDRLKQVMLDLDPAFDEKTIGYNKFSRFVQDAASKGILTLRRGENGQFEIVTGASEPAGDSGKEASGRRGRSRSESRKEPRAAKPAPIPETPAPELEPVKKEAPAAATLEPEKPSAPERRPDQEKQRGSKEETAPVVAGAPGLTEAYALLQEAVRQVSGGAGKAVRDGDVKREMLRLAPGFDEGSLGFSKFTRFLRQAHDAEVIDLNRANGGNYDVSLPANGKRVPFTPRAATPSTPVESPTPTTAPAARAAEGSEPAPEKTSTTRQSTPGALRGRRGTRAGAAEGPPPILPGQAIEPVKVAAETTAAAETPAVDSPEVKQAPDDAAAAKPRARRGRRGRGKAATSAPTEDVTPAPTFSEEALGLPRDAESIQRYLANSYRGVGKKTAEQLLAEFGSDVFRAFAEMPSRVTALLGEKRAGGLLEQWAADFARRGDGPEAAPSGEAPPAQETPPTEEKKPAARRSRRGRAASRKE